MLKLFISKSNGLDEKEMSVLAMLNGLYSNKQEVLITSASILGYMASGRFLNVSIQRDRTILKNIKLGIKSLADKEYIKILDQNGDNYVISNDGLEVNTEKEKFVVVETWEMQKIFSQAKKPFNVFMFFVNLIGTINNTTKEWHMSQDEMTSLWDCSKRTVNDYLEQLEQMQLIYVYRHRKRRNDGTYHKLNNSYGRYCDKDAIIKAAQKYADTVECEDFCERIDRRAIKLRYNAFCNGTKKYRNDSAAILELYKECKKYNRSLKSNPVEGVYDGEWKQGEPLDLTVFPEDIMNEVDDDWGETDPMLHDFSVEEMLDMPTISEVKWSVADSDPKEKLPWVTDSDLQSEGNNPKIDSETDTPNLAERNDLEMIDIDSLFDEDTDDKRVLSQEEAWELFA